MSKGTSKNLIPGIKKNQTRDLNGRLIRRETVEKPVEELSNEITSAFPQETARAAVTASVHIVTAGLKALSKSITQGKPSDIAKNMKFCMDMADKLLRAAEFAAGKPDSRPDNGLDAVFAKLNLEQSLELKKWLNGDSNGTSVDNRLTTLYLNPSSS